MDVLEVEIKQLLTLPECYPVGWVLAKRLAGLLGRVPPSQRQQLLAALAVRETGVQVAEPLAHSPLPPPDA